MSTEPPIAPSQRERRRGPWRVGTPVVGVLVGGLLITSAMNSEGTDLRPERYSDLASVVSNERQRVEELQQRASQLSGEIDVLSDQVNDRDVNRLQRRATELEGPAGLTPVSGAGVTVTLSDAPDSVVPSDEVDIDLLVVHQQDIEAVVNAMWAGGAEAITIQGQRIISTTGIKCSGSNVRLHGIPYAQPYRITAIGDQSRLTNAIDGDQFLQTYREQAERPDVDIGWDLSYDDHVEAPAYDGTLDLIHAQPLGG